MIQQEQTYYAFKALVQFLVTLFQLGLNRQVILLLVGLLHKLAIKHFIFIQVAPILLKALVGQTHRLC